MPFRLSAGRSLWPLPGLVFSSGPSPPSLHHCPSHYCPWSVGAPAAGGGGGGGGGRWRRRRRRRRRFSSDNGGRAPRLAVRTTRSLAQSCGRRTRNSRIRRDCDLTNGNRTRRHRGARLSSATSSASRRDVSCPTSQRSLSATQSPAREQRSTPPSNRITLVRAAARHGEIELGAANADRAPVGVPML